jgi:hypothetical protein
MKLPTPEELALRFVNGHAIPPVSWPRVRWPHSWLGIDPRSWPPGGPFRGTFGGPSVPLANGHVWRPPPLSPPAAVQVGGGRGRWEAWPPKDRAAFLERFVRDLEEAPRRETERGEAALRAWKKRPVEEQQQGMRMETERRAGVELGWMLDDPEPDPERWRAVVDALREADASGQQALRLGLERWYERRGQVRGLRRTPYASGLHVPVAIPRETAEEAQRHHEATCEALETGDLPLWEREVPHVLQAARDVMRAKLHQQDNGLADRHDRTAQAAAARLWSWWKPEPKLDATVPWFWSMLADKAAKALEGTEYANSIGTRDELAKALRVHAEKVLERTGIGRTPVPGVPGNKQPEQLAMADTVPHALTAAPNGVLRWTEVLAGYLVELGAKGAEQAEKLRKVARDRMAAPVAKEDAGLVVFDPFVGAILAERLDGEPWKVWTRGAWLHALARAVWHDVVLPAIKAEERPAGLSTLFLDRARDAYTNPGREVSDAPGEAVVRSRGGLVVGKVPYISGATLQTAIALSEASTRPAFPLLISAVVWKLHENLVRAAQGQTRGGYENVVTMPSVTQWSRELRVSPGDLKDALQAGQCLQVTDASGNVLGGLFTYDIRRGGRGRAGHVRITASAFLMEAMAGQTRDNFAPMFPPDAPVPRVPSSDRATWGAQTVLFHFVILPRLRRDAGQLAQHGGVHLTLEWWREVCESAGLPSDMATQVRDAYLQGGDKGSPPALREVSAGRFTLTDSYQAIAESLTAGGERTLQRTAAGKRAAESKRKHDKRRR